MANETHDDQHESHGSIGLYMGVFVALCVLTTMSFLTYFDFWNNSVPKIISWLFMGAVACTKAMLVITFFMHLKWEGAWKWVLTAPMLVMSALLIFALVPDVGLRMRHASQDRMIYAAERPAEEAIEHEHEEHGEEGHEHEVEALRPAA